MKRFACSLLMLMCGAACTQGAELAANPTAEGGVETEARAVEQGWMGSFSRHDPELAALLKANPGWGHLRDMALFEAMQVFANSSQPADRLGAARAYLTLADLYESLDRLLLAAENDYFATLPEPLPAAQRARRLVVWLRTEQRAGAQAELAAAAEGFEFTWHLAAARLGRAPDTSAPKPGTPEQRVLGAVAAYLWGLPPVPGGSTPYDQGLAAFRAGDLTGGVLTLQMLEFSPTGVGPGPELLLYPLLQRAFAGLARDALQGLSGAAARFLEAEAHAHLGETEAAAALWRRAAVDEQAAPLETAATLVFSPMTGEPELRAMARARAGDRVEGPASPLVALAGANSAAAVADALARLATAPAPSGSQDGAAVAKLYAARQADAARWAAKVLWRLGDDRAAVAALEQAHRKSGGYRPDFVNPPGFLVDLALAHQRVGEYATAVAVLFSLAEEDPSARVAYESLKRLYASRTGGVVPPR